MSAYFFLAHRASLVNLHVLVPWVEVLSWRQGVGEGVCVIPGPGVCSSVSPCLRPVLGQGAHPGSLPHLENGENTCLSCPFTKEIDNGYEKAVRRLTCYTNSSFPFLRFWKGLGLPQALLIHHSLFSRFSGSRDGLKSQGQQKGVGICLSAPTPRRARLYYLCLEQHFAKEANSYEAGDTRNKVFIGGISGEPAAPVPDLCRMLH